MGIIEDAEANGHVRGFADRLQPVLLVVGLALSYQLMRNRCLQEIVPEAYLGWYLAVPCLIAILLCFVVSRERFPWKAFIRSRSILVCSSFTTLMFGIAGICKHALVAQSLVDVVFACAMITGAVTFIQLLFAWVVLLQGIARRSSRELIAYLLFSELVSMFLSILLFYLSPIRAVDIILTPLFATLCLLACRRSSPRPSGHPESAVKLRVPMPYIMLLAVALAASIIICGVTFRLYPSLTGQDLIVKFCVGVFEMLAIIALVMLARDIEVWVYLAWICVMCVLMFGLLVFGIIEQDSMSVGMGVITASRACSEAFLLITLLLKERDAYRPNKVIFGIVVPTVAGGLLGYVAIPLSFVRLDIGAREALNTISLVFGFILTLGIISMLAWIGLRGLSGGKSGSLIRFSADGNSAVLSEKQLSATEVIASRHGLTEREVTTLCYLMRGYSLQRIAEAEVISINTVRSHVKNLYQKTGVHSRQEIIDKTEGFLECVSSSGDDGLSATAHHLDRRER